MHLAGRPTAEACTARDTIVNAILASHESDLVMIASHWARCLRLSGFSLLAPENAIAPGIHAQRSNSRSMKCIFLRHGIAADRETWNGRDEDRPLTDEGVDRMRREAKALSDNLTDIDVVVTSPLLRARQTAEILAKALHLSKQVVEDEQVVDLNAQALAHILEEHHSAESIVLVGHEPSMSETIGELVGGRIELKKGGIACVDLPDRSVMHGTLEWLLTPKLILR